MKKIITIVVFMICLIQSKSQTTAFSKTFTKQQARSWIITNLKAVVLYEETSGVKPIFSLDDTSCIVKLPHSQYIGNVPVDMNLIFSYKEIFVMDMDKSNADGTKKQDLIEFTTHKLSATFITDKSKLPSEKKRMFVIHLMNAFYILADKRDQMF